MSEEKETKDIDYKKIVKLIIVLGILVRAIFLFNSRVYFYQYDFGINYLETNEDYSKLFTEKSTDNNTFLENRGFDYVRTIFLTGKLPNSCDGQLYHPPLNFAILALWLRIINIFPFSDMIKIESMRIIPFIYSIISIVFLNKLLNLFKISDKGKTITLLFYTITPLFIHMSSMLNGDMLLTTFGIIAIYYLYKWYDNPNIKDAFILALMIGLGINTKTSMGVIGLLSVLFFIIKLVKEVRKILKNNSNDYSIIKKLFGQALIFILVVTPLMFWYQIRNYVLFDQPFFSVIEAKEEYYIGDKSFIDKLLSFGNEISNNSLGYKDCNVISYIIKSLIIHGDNEDSYVLLGFKILIGMLLIISIICSIYNLINKKREKEVFLDMLVIGLWFMSYAFFIRALPYSCSMHSRYIVIPLLFLVIQISKTITIKENI